MPAGCGLARGHEVTLLPPYRWRQDTVVNDMPQFDLPLEQLQELPLPPGRAGRARRLLARHARRGARGGAASHLRPLPRGRLPTGRDQRRHVQRLRRPARARVADRAERAPTDSFPCLVRFIGYGGGRDIPLRYLATTAAGVAVFVMDTRGQAGTWSPGGTGDDDGPLARPRASRGHVPRHLLARDLLLPSPLHRCRARDRDGCRARLDRRDAHRRRRHEPGRRRLARRSSARSRPCPPRPGGDSLPLRLPAGNREGDAASVCRAGRVLRAVPRPRRTGARDAHVLRLRVLATRITARRSSASR